MEKWGMKAVQAFILTVGVSIFAGSSLTYALTTQQMIDIQLAAEAAAKAAADAVAAQKFQDANPGLKACIDGLSATGCKHGGDPDAKKRRVDLKLFQGGTAPGNELTGFYDDNGARVAAGTLDECKNTPNCVFRIEAWMTPKCPGHELGKDLGATCAKAENFQIDWRVSQVNLIPGMGSFQTIETVINTDKPPVTLPMSAILATKYENFNCKDLVKPGDPEYEKKSKYIVIGVDATGQPICDEDPNQKMIDALKEEVCRNQINDVWKAGPGGNSTGSTASGSTATIQCEKINVAKVFTLAGGTGTTATCAAPGKVVHADGTVNPDLKKYDGGVVKYLNNDGSLGAIYDIPTLRIRYGLSPSADGQFSCVPYLVNGVHTAKSCVDAGGTVVKSNGTDSGGDWTATGLFCKLSASGCPSGWAQNSHWSTTSNVDCPVQDYALKWNTSDGCHTEAGTNSCDAGACPGTTARDGTYAHSGSHDWKDNNTIEQNTTTQAQRRSGKVACEDGGSCSCHDYGVVSCSANRSQIGCY